MMVKEIFFIVIVALVKRCWSYNSQKEKEPLLQTSFDYGFDDYGFHLGDLTEETVMNGEETEPHQYPWMVFVCGKFDSIRCTEACGGTLIHRQHVLTAAHCVAVGTTEDTFVITGAHNVIEKMEKFDFVYLDEIILHPEYDPNREKEFQRSPDIAILRLRESVVFDPKVNAISLPNFSQVDKERVKKVGIFPSREGWGFQFSNIPLFSSDRSSRNSYHRLSVCLCGRKLSKAQFLHQSH